MSLSHKAYSFDWSLFASDELFGLLQIALSNGVVGALDEYISSHSGNLKDPTMGESLQEDWRDDLEKHDVHAYADLALTQFYDPVQDEGLGMYWIDLSDRLPKEDQLVLLGDPFGSSGIYFDPGRQGSYFQTPRQVVHSLMRIRLFDQPMLDEERDALRYFEALLIDCVKKKRGLYVTF